MESEDVGSRLRRDEWITLRAVGDGVLDVPPAFFRIVMSVLNVEQPETYALEKLPFGSEVKNAGMRVFCIPAFFIII